MYVLHRHNLKSSLPADEARDLVIDVSRFQLIPNPLILLHALRLELSRPRDWREAHASILKLLQSLGSVRVASIDTVDLDPVARARHMQTPVPR